jgi:hypothetical protein
MNANPKGMTWAGRGLTLLICLMLTMSAVFKFQKAPEVIDQMVQKFGYPESTLVFIGIAEICCVVLYAIPQTSVLGAVLLAGYLGGAIATHVRVNDNFLGPAIGGVLVWLALFLREPRLRALLPFRTSASPPHSR